MSTLLDIKTEAASLLTIAPTAFTVNGQDLFVQAANSARRTAEMQFDLEFTRQFAKVVVNSATGGDLSSAVDINGDPVKIKTIVEVGFLDSAGNLSPVEWTTVAEGIERQRMTGSYPSQRYGGPGDTVLVDPPQTNYFCGQYQFRFAGGKVFSFPRATNPSQNFDLWMEVYAFTPDWTALTESLDVTGTTVSNGEFSPIGMLNGKVIYKNTFNANFLWFKSGVWYISDGADIDGTPTDKYSLTSVSDDPTGSYTGAGAFTGTAVVTFVSQTSATTEIWTAQGYDYILWSAIIKLNHRWKIFVPRTEGNLAPPADMAQAALTSLLEWDTAQFEQFRRHSR